MNTESQGKTERLATTSLILGILSFGLLVLPILILLRAKFYGIRGDLAEALSIAFLAGFLFLGSLLFGLIGCFTAIIALRKITREGNDNKLKRIATTGLVLGGLGASITLLIFIYVSVASSGNRPPDMQTPIPSTVIP